MTDFNILFNHAFTHYRHGQYAQAQALFEALIEDAPHPDALRWLGMTLQAQSKFQEAIAVYKQLNALEPNTGQAHCGLAVCYSHTGDHRLAGYHYERAMKLSPHIPDMRWNRALHLLSEGQYEEGWKDYKWGFMVPGCRTRRTLAEEWDGEHIEDGKTLFVWGEQGFGDTIQFARYLKVLRDRVGPNVFIKFECMDQLVPLFASDPHIDEVISRQVDFSIPGGFDYHVSLMSLPAIFKTTLDTIPWYGSYITPDLAKIKRWANRLTGKDLKVGCVWRGSQGHPNDKQRSMSVTDLEPLSHIEGVQLYGLNVGAEPFPYGVDIAPEIEDFSDTAAIIECLDLVVSVDTAVAHLAGAMGKITKLMLPYQAEWRWGRDTVKTPWYPNTSLYRGPWHITVDDVRDHLVELKNRVAEEQA